MSLPTRDEIAYALDPAAFQTYSPGTEPMWRPRREEARVQADAVLALLESKQSPLVVTDAITFEFLRNHLTTFMGDHDGGHTPRCYCQKAKARRLLAALGAAQPAPAAESGSTHRCNEPGCQFKEPPTATARERALISPEGKAILAVIRETLNSDSFHRNRVVPEMWWESKVERRLAEGKS